MSDKNMLTKQHSLLAALTFRLAPHYDAVIPGFSIKIKVLIKSLISE